MDLGGISKVRGMMGAIATDIRRKNSEADRDPNAGQGYQSQEKPKHLSPEQENEALEKLNNLPAFKTAGLTASIVRQEGELTYIVVKDKSGQIVRNLPYEQIIEVYLNRNNEFNVSGRLLNKAV